MTNSDLILEFKTVTSFTLDKKAVMRLINRGNWYRAKNGPLTRKWNGVRCDGPVKGIEDSTDTGLFRPTTDEADAMKVLKTCGMREVEGTSFIVCSYSHPSYSLLSKRHGHWSVGRTRRGEFGSDYVTNAVTLPVAICKFAKQLYTEEP